MEQKDLKATLESILFVSNRPLTVSDFAKVLEVEPQTIKTALDEILTEKKDHGLILMESNGSYQLGTNSRYSTAVKNFLNAELREKLTDATVEVLAIVAYRQPISKAEIEAIRGVNSQYSIRNLLMRGLIEKIPNPNDARSFFYQTTTEFLQHFGLTSVNDLPEFNKLVEQIKLPQTPALTQDAAAQTEPEPKPEAFKEITALPGQIPEPTAAESPPNPTEPQKEEFDEGDKKE
jgi:segregation and condensation protein B